MPKYAGGKGPFAGNTKGMGVKKARQAKGQKGSSVMRGKRPTAATRGMPNAAGMRGRG